MDCDGIISKICYMSIKVKVFTMVKQNFFVSKLIVFVVCETKWRRFILLFIVGYFKF